MKKTLLLPLLAAALALTACGKSGEPSQKLVAVSYTHLTLPTKA